MDEDGLGGVTSNPAIFEKAITGSTDYAEALVELQKRKDLDAMGVYEIIAIKDIQDAADILRPVYDGTKMRDGYVSLEVSPFLARDTEGTFKDARRLWKAVNRPNLMVKVPATPRGIPAIEQLISEGINVNVTLLFAQEMYEKVALAYIAGLQKYVAAGGDPSHVSSVASFFISRIDSMVDAIVKAKLKVELRSQGAGAAQEPARQGGHCQRQAHLSALQRDLLRPGLGRAGEERRADAAGPVGQHQHQGSDLLRRAVCGRADRARHGEHHAAADAGCVPRSRQAQGESGSEPGCRQDDHGRRWKPSAFR